MKFVPEGWNPIAHHITLIDPTVQKHGRLPKPYLNLNVSVNIVAIAKDERVIAGIIDVGETILPYKGPKYLHVTIATNPIAEGRPEMSNELDLSRAIQIEPVQVAGKIMEIEK